MRIIRRRIRELPLYTFGLDGATHIYGAITSRELTESCSVLQLSGVGAMPFVM